MNRENIKFLGRVKSANTIILSRFANINVKKSVDIVDKGITRTSVSGKPLISTIKIDLMSNSKINVIASDYGTSFPEIERGIGGKREFRSFARYPKLERWAEVNLENMPKNTYIITNNTHRTRRCNNTDFVTYF